jgi:hypothetical protein
MKIRQILIPVQILAIYCWMALLVDSDSYYAPFFITGAVGSICCCINIRDKRRLCKGKIRILCALFSLLYSAAVTAANYKIFYNLAWPADAGSFFRNLYRGISFLLCFLGGIAVAWNILSCAAGKLKDFTWPQRPHKLKPGMVFLLPVICISCVNLSVLFLVQYPGNISPDSLSQIEQSLTGVYSNHHPFYHTLIIRFFLQTGLALFGEINAAVALYNVFQIIVMSCCFSYVIVTLYQMNLPSALIVLCALWYTAMPFHIMYSFTMWKDVMFGGMIMIFLTAVYRILKKIGTHPFFNTAPLLLGSVGICLFRSNGWFAYLICFLCFALLFWSTRKRLCGVFLAVLAFTFLLKHPLLSCLQVSQPDTVEALSIPIQQIARVVVDCDDLSESQRTLLEQVANVDAIPVAYTHYISDPMKELIRQRNNLEYLSEQKGLFLQLYLELGISHPDVYLKAWVDQTKGYWNGGYDYPYWDSYVHYNEMGIVRTVNSAAVSKLWDAYLWLFTEGRVLQIFLCIGFHVWITAFLAFVSIVRRDKPALFITIPVLAVVLSLLAATPVFAEFRYAYGVFCSLPFLISAAFYSPPCRQKNSFCVI